jgi:UDP-GlcNAc:undecaprenyl-phosphate GlcNAc-1-phosphate transferase
MLETGLLVLRWAGLAALAAFCFTVLLILILSRLAPRLGLMNRPGGRRTHLAPTPQVGGLAIAFGAFPVAMLLYPVTQPLIGLAAAASLLLVVGVIDDIYDIRWYWRLLAQAAAALILFYLGGVKVELIGAAFGFPQHTLGALSAPFTVLATVGVINALNMADGIDGLAGTLAAAALAMLAAASIYAGNVSLATGLLVLLGAVLGFLAFNLRTPWRPRAAVFLGAGSEFLGLVLAWASFRLTQNVAHPVTPVLAPFLVAPPVIDCLVLMLRRVRHGGLPFSADRNHLHHLLTDAGVSVSAAVALVAGASLVIGLGAALSLHAGVMQPVMVGLYVALIGAYYVFSADRERAVALFARMARAASGPVRAQPPAGVE